MRAAALLLSLLAAGCACPTSVDLDSKWRPLEKIVDDAAKPAPNDPPGVPVYWTTGSTLHGPVCDFLAHATTDQEGVLAHEQVHARRQFAYPGGPPAYAARYSADGDFLALEEDAAYEAQVRWVVSHGGTVDVAYVANFMSRHYVEPKGSRYPGRAIFGYDETVKWLQAFVDDELAKRRNP